MLEKLRPAQHPFVIRNPETHVALSFRFGQVQGGDDFAEVRRRVGRDAIVLEERVEAHRRRETHQRVGNDLFLTDGRQHGLDLDDALG